MAVEYAELSGDMETGYCLYSLLNIGRIVRSEGRNVEAKRYFKQVKKLAGRKDPVYKAAVRELRKKS